MSSYDTWLATMSFGPGNMVPRVRTSMRSVFRTARDHAVLARLATCQLPILVRFTRLLDSAATTARPRFDFSDANRKHRVDGADLVLAPIVTARTRGPGVACRPRAERYKLFIPYKP
jgi:hypothetical protein